MQCTHESLPFKREKYIYKHVIVKGLPLRNAATFLSAYWQLQTSAGKATCCLVTQFFGEESAVPSWAGKWHCHVEGVTGQPGQELWGVRGSRAPWQRSIAAASRGHERRFGQVGGLCSAGPAVSPACRFVAAKASSRELHLGWLLPCFGCLLTQPPTAPRQKTCEAKRGAAATAFTSPPATSSSSRSEASADQNYTAPFPVSSHRNKREEGKEKCVAVH